MQNLSYIGVLSCGHTQAQDEYMINKYIGIYIYNIPNLFIVLFHEVRHYYSTTGEQKQCF
jgi:hypothetical protein